MKKVIELTEDSAKLEDELNTLYLANKKFNEEFNLLNQIGLGQKLLIPERYKKIVI